MATLAQAEVTEGRFQLGLESTLLASERGTLESASGVDIDYSASSAGISAGQGVVLGYGVSERLVLGARVAQTRESSRWTGMVASESRTSHFDLLPRLEVLLGSSNPRLSLIGTVGYRSSISETIATLSDPTLGTVSERTRLTSTGLSFGAGLGLHGFVGNHASLDAALGVLRTSGESRSGGETGDLTSTAVMLTVGVSAWLGGEKPVAAPATAKAEEPPEAAQETEARESARTAMSAFGVLTRNTELDNSAELSLVAQPKQDGEHVYLRLSLLGMPPPYLNSWTECEIGNVLAGDDVLALDNVVVDNTGGQTTVRARATVKALVQLVRAKRLAALEICSNRNHLGSAARGALLEFLLSFKRTAERAGTWRPDAIQPGEGPPSPPTNERASMDVEASRVNE